jgi:hypothetical protein
MSTSIAKSNTKIRSNTTNAQSSKQVRDREFERVTVFCFLCITPLRAGNGSNEAAAGVTIPASDVA